ncbi:hypothetical protein ACFXG4_01495 [Nocardia sp. NPDC059246]|uniref:hypothetical protein n=1 Tax=unclassified Nocardia TaxID=2637762 RepID=UPI0036846CF2
MGKSKRGRGGRKHKGGRGGGPRPERALVSHEDEFAPFDGQGFDLREPIDRVLADAAELGDDTDPLEVEFLVADLLAGGDEDLGFAKLFGAWAVLVLEERATSDALGTLRALARLSTAELSRAARAAADRLEAQGVSVPGWSVRSAAPLRAVACTRSTAIGASVLVGSFERADRIHTFLVWMLHDGGETAEVIDLLPGDRTAVAQQLAGADLPGVTERLSPWEFRRQVEAALDRRARRERAALMADLDVFDSPDDDPEADLPPYALAATVLRAQLRTIDATVRCGPACTAGGAANSMSGGNDRHVIADGGMSESASPG